ncbi:MAG: Nif3-like dinuclear metal center hexameric protein [Bacillota bacterium]
MVCKVEHIMGFMEEIAPKKLAEPWDNVGLMVGDSKKEVKKILVALDAIPEVIAEAIEQNADMIVTHHPFFLFQKIKSIQKNTPLGKKIYDLIENEIAVFSAHTNLDIVDGGINDILAEKLNLQNVDILDVTQENPDGTTVGLGRVGKLQEEMSLLSFGQLVKDTFPVGDILRIVGDKDKMVKKVALCSGSGASLISRANRSGADVYVTGDMKYHEAQDAQELGLAVIDLTHYASEVIVVEVLAKRLQQFVEKKKLSVEIIISTVDGQTFWSV